MFRIVPIAAAVGASALLFAVGACAWAGKAEVPASDNIERADAIELSDAEWKERLDPEQYRVLRQQGTERAFTGKYWAHKVQGTYTCAACGLELFESDTKFKSGTGWPSFTAPARADVVETETDSSLGMTRTEVHCARCGGHLGHLFPDGPAPTGLRYCINSVSLSFDPAAPEAAEEKPTDAP